MNTLLVVVAIVAVATAVSAAWIAWQATSRERALSEARVRALARAIEGNTESGEPAAPAGLFVSSISSSGTLKQLVPALAAGALIVSTMVGGALAIGGSHGSRAPTAGPGEDLASAPLELASLDHARENGRVTISGLVRNPLQAPVRDDVWAMVSFVDVDGRIVETGQARLAVARLAAGEESRFTVSESAPAGAVRYRLSFRHDNGDIVAHVDRRQGALK